MNRRDLLLVLATAALLPSLAAAQTATLVKDISQGIGGDAVPLGQITLAQGKIFFVTDPTGSPTPWVSDGTQAGTRMLTEDCDHEPSCDGVTMLGAAGGVAFWSRVNDLWTSDGTRAGTARLQAPTPDIRLLTDGVFFGGAFLTFGCSTETGCQLWRTDGTVAGTRLVHDLVPGPAGGLTGSLTVAGSHVFFGAGDGSRALGLWVTDGTAAGTHRIGDLSFSTLDHLTAAGDRVYFLAKTSAGLQVWTSDGTAAGTVMLTNLPSAASFPEPESEIWFRGTGSRVYFIADDVVHGQEIWRSDGTAAGTQRITDFGTAEPFPRFEGVLGLQEVANGRVVFWASDGIHPDPLLWKTDGDPASSTALLQCAGTCPAYDVYVHDFFAAGQRAVFVADGSHGPAVWSTDGTPSGTVEVFPSCDSCLVKQSLQAWPQGVSFVAADTAHGQEIWLSDGTRAGTKRLTDLPGTGSPFPDDDLPPAATDGHKVVFGAASVDGSGLWTADAAGTRLLAELPSDGAPSSPADLVPFAGSLAFSACAEANREVWWAAPEGLDAAPLTASADVSCDGFPTSRELTPVGDLLYYLGYDAELDVALWRTDGTHAPVLLLSGVFGTSMTGFQGKLYFTRGPVVWKSDGTPEGTTEAFQPAGSDSSTQISPLTVANGALWFGVAKDFSSPYKLWRSDGTQAGTRQVAGPAAISPTFATLGSQVYFLGGDGIYSPSQLWKSDGSDAGTVPAGGPFDDLVNLSSKGPELIAYQGLLYFVAQSPQGQWNLWRSDGTPQGTLALTALLDDGASDVRRPGLTGVGNRVYFTAFDNTHGRELWSTDGTVAGTGLVKDIVPGPATSSPAWLTAAGGRLWFSADDGVHGAELWQSDGTEAGTHLAQDIAPEAVSSSPRDLTAAGNRLWFTADDGATGREVWSLPVTDPGTCHPSAEHLCLGGSGGGRYQVEASWRTAAGAEGRGTAVALTADTGYFWFFSPTNVEAVIKVLDGTGVNGHVWVFYGALSNVEYTLTVTDTQTGLTRRYFNPQGQLASVGDVYGFGPRGANGANPHPSIATAPPSPLPLIAERHDKAATVPCHANAQTLCLSDDRFAVTVAWKDFQGHTGQGTAAPLSGDSGTTGTFWFFNSSNVELVVKALDGRPVNKHFWLFYGALSNVEYTLTVTDTQTGTIKTYTNPSGRFASVADTQAF
ncbi:MAG TPA: ELWxxDGT repeat protein [Thermoanaerobaculia bacterium]|nr:ELWxxDGT repeat protein [Thermoanaerobaculia bacterium]